MKKILGLLIVLAGFAGAQTPLPSPTNGAGGGGGTGCNPGAGAANHIVVTDGAGGCGPATPTIASSTITATLTGAASLNLLIASNLSDLADKATARTNLGITQANIAGLWSGGTNCGTTTNALLVNGNCAVPGGGTPAGTSGQVQWNNGSGAFGADSGLAYNSGAKALGVIGTITSGQNGTAQGKVTLNGATSGSADLSVTATGGTLNLGSTSATADSSGNVKAISLCSGSSCPSVTAGTGGLIAGPEGTVPSACAASAVDCIYFDSTQHLPLLSANNGSYIPIVAGAQYKTLSCQPGLGDGLNAMAAGTYLESTCWNKTGTTYTITGIQCFTDNAGSSTLNVTDGSNTALLTGAITCSSTIASGTPSGTTTIANNGFMKFTFVADGTSKQTTWVVSGTY